MNDSNEIFCVLQSLWHCR